MLLGEAIDRDDFDLERVDNAGLGRIRSMLTAAGIDLDRVAFRHRVQGELDRIHYSRADRLLGFGAGVARNVSFQDGKHRSWLADRGKGPGHGYFAFFLEGCFLTAALAMRTAFASSPLSSSTEFAVELHCLRLAGVLAFLVWRFGPSLGSHGIRSAAFRPTPAGGPLRECPPQSSWPVRVETASSQRAAERQER